jgi:uncharacterized membrane protein (UPF0136 family)
MKNHQIMIANALILIVMGLAGFIQSGSTTALIADGVGIILFILAFPVKKENHIAAHIAVVLTLITAVSFFIVGIKRSNIMIIVMAVVTLIALVLYIMSFVKRKKERQNRE